MAFPEVERVIYEKNPLEEVICQLRFPPILKIETEVPADFQEHIRGQYPLYKTKPVGRLPRGLPEEIANLVALDFPLLPSGKAHEFTSRDQQWKVSLTKDFMALSCSRYERWEGFKEQLRQPLLALEELYRPSFYARLGLRYRDVIRRSALELDNLDWSELLQPWVTGVMSRPEVTKAIQEIGAEWLMSLPDQQGAVRVRHGLAMDEETRERCYLIDADFFDETQTEPPHALAKLDYLNRQSRFLFRWCIKDRLHKAMGPQPI
jgi:uncharacterized protein (TIGR04255 family)